MLLHSLFVYACDAVAERQIRFNTTENKPIRLGSNSDHINSLLQHFNETLMKHNKHIVIDTVPDGLRSLIPSTITFCESDSGFELLEYVVGNESHATVFNIIYYQGQLAGAKLFSLQSMWDVETGDVIGTDSVVYRVGLVVPADEAKQSVRNAESYYIHVASVGSPTYKSWQDAHTYTVNDVLNIAQRVYAKAKRR